MSEMGNVATVSAEGVQDARMVGRLKAVSTFLLLVLAGVSFAAGVPGLLAAGQWAQLGQLAFLTPIAIDGGLVFFSASAMAWRAETARASVLGWTMVVLLTLVSVASQVAHVLVDVATPGVQHFVGAGVASMFPLLVLASTRQFEMLRFARLIDREAHRVAAADAARATVEQSRARAAGKKSPRRPATATVATVNPAAVASRKALLQTAEGVGQPEPEVAAWVRARLLDGDRPSGETVASMLGKSRATGVRLVARVADELDTDADREDGPRLALVQAGRGN